MAESPTNRPEPSQNPVDPATPPSTPTRPTVPEVASDTLAGDPALLPPTPKSAPTQHAASAPRAFPSLSGFEVLRELGRGGMGVVYLVRHCQMNRTEALKMILSGEHASAADLARFHTEARAVASLHHNSFVQIYDVGESGGHPYLRLEYINGGNLEDWLENRLGTSCIAPGTAARMVEQLARAMHHMHEKGLIHRDLKPANVLVNLPDEAMQGSVKLEDCALKISDFGLAREVRGPGANTRGIIGTPAYMAPEQAMGAGVDRRADVYALGAIFYRLVTGKAPHDGDDPFSVLARLIQPGHDPLPPSHLRPDVSPAVDAICRKSLEKDPLLRYPTAKDLADDLKRFVETGSGPSGAAAVPSDQAAGLQAAPPTIVLTPKTPRRRWRAVAVWSTAAALLASVCAIGYVVFGRWSRAKDNQLVVKRETTLRHEEEAEASTALNDAKDARDKGDKKAALQSYWKAEEVFKKLHDSNPDRPEYLLALARAHIDEGSLWLERRDGDEAEKDFTEAIEILTKEIPREAAGDDVALAVADAYHHRGEHQESLMKWRSALALYQDALKIREGLCWKNSSDRAFRRDLARSLSSIGDMQLHLGHLNRAREAYDEAEKFRRQLVEEDGRDEEARFQLARSCNSKGKYFLWRGDLAAADRQFCEARGAYDALVSLHPAVIRNKAELAEVLLWLAEVHLANNKPADVAELVGSARDLVDGLQGADDVLCRSGRLRCGVVQARLRMLTDPAAAAEDAAKVIDQMMELRKLLNTEKRQFSCEDMYNSAAARAIRGDRDRALSTLKSAIDAYGYRNFVRLHLDVAFQPLLTKDAAFRKAVESLEADVKKADAKADEESTSGDGSTS